MLDKNLLKGAIARKGLTQRELAKMIGISENTLSSRMVGISKFNTDEIDDICKILEISDNNEKADIFLSNSSHKWDTERTDV